MSETSQDVEHDMDLNDDDILDYLRDNPKFLKRNPEAFDLLKQPFQGQKGVADFQSYMIERLKADKEEVMKPHKSSWKPPAPT